MSQLVQQEAVFHLLLMFHLTISIVLQILVVTVLNLLVLEESDIIIINEKKMNRGEQQKKILINIKSNKKEKVCFLLTV